MVLYSIIATCEKHDVNPEAYITDVLLRIHDHPKSRLVELLPHRWKGAEDLFLGERELALELIDALRERRDLRDDRGDLLVLLREPFVLLRELYAKRLGFTAPFAPVFGRQRPSLIMFARVSIPSCK